MKITDIKRFYGLNNNKWMNANWVKIQNFYSIMKTSNVPTWYIIHPSSLFHYLEWNRQKFKMSKKFNKCHSILRVGFSIIVNISCIIFVGWKSTECLIKYFNYPKGTTVDIKQSSNTAQFPTITIFAVSSDEEHPGLRWNITHLNKCGIPG